MSKKYIDALRVFNGEYAMLHNSEELKTVFMNGKMVRGVEEDWSTKYFTLVSLEDGNTITFERGGEWAPINTFYYSLDNGATWVERTQQAPWTVKYTTSWQLDAGEKVMLKGSSLAWGRPMHDNEGDSLGNTPSVGTDGRAAAWSIRSSKYYLAKGNIMSMVKGDNFANNSSFSNIYTNNFKWMFYGSTTLIDASCLVLPATSLSEECYGSMFQGCTSLRKATQLPATTLQHGCYEYMFYGCSSLTAGPSLPATTLAEDCYKGMFADCTSLATTPELPATKLAQSCYHVMFANCTSLASAPNLYAQAMAVSCYESMFGGCTSLTTAPVLPSTSLAAMCYANMFDGCVSLTHAPDLPATKLKSNCYFQMFYGCSSLRYVKAMFKTLSGTYQWLHGVSATGTFVKNTSATWTDTGESAVPSGWTIQYASS